MLFLIPKLSVCPCCFLHFLVLFRANVRSAPGRLGADCELLPFSHFHADFVSPPSRCFSLLTYYRRSPMQPSRQSCFVFSNSQTVTVNLNNITSGSRKCGARGPLNYFNIIRGESCSFSRDLFSVKWERGCPVSSLLWKRGRRPTAEAVFQRSACAMMSSRADFMHLDFITGGWSMLRYHSFCWGRWKTAAESNLAGVVFCLFFIFYFFAYFGGYLKCSSSFPSCSLSKSAFVLASASELLRVCGKTRVWCRPTCRD